MGKPYREAAEEVDWCVQSIRYSAKSAGMVWINAPLLGNDASPFGGSKLSGMERQIVSEGPDAFRETKQ